MALDQVGINLLLGGRLVPEDVVRQNGTDLADFLSEAKSPAIIHLGVFVSPSLRESS